MHVKASAHSNLTYVHHAATCTCMRRSSYFSQSFFPESTTEYPPTVRHHRHHRRVVMTARLSSYQRRHIRRRRRTVATATAAVRCHRPIQSIDRTNERSIERTNGERTNEQRSSPLTHSLTHLRWVGTSVNSGQPAARQLHSLTLTDTLPRANNE